MGEKTEINWTDSTFNPWVGCTKISPACDYCYAAELMDTRMGKARWGAGQPRVRTNEKNWNLPLRWNRIEFRECSDCGWRGERKASAETDCPQCGGTKTPLSRRRVFCSSLADVFDNEVNPQWRLDLFALIHRTPNLDWLLLTKRVSNVVRMLEAAIQLIETSEGWDNGEVATHPLAPLRTWLADWVLLGKSPSNVWLGATICNQVEADRDIPKLLATPAQVRFLSMEPLLGPVNFRWAPYAHPASHQTYREYEALRKLDWIIAGGESGTQARPMHPAWVQALRDQCAQAGVPFLFKQWGEWSPATVAAGGDLGREMRVGRAMFVQGDVREADGRFRKGDAVMRRIGKGESGRELDGRTHHAFPAAKG